MKKTSKVILLAFLLVCVCAIPAFAGTLPSSIGTSVQMPTSDDPLAMLNAVTDDALGTVVGDRVESAADGVYDCDISCTMHVKFEIWIAQWGYSIGGSPQYTAVYDSSTGNTTVTIRCGIVLVIIVHGYLAF